MNDTETLSTALPGTLEEAARRLLNRTCKRGLLLATAESCTGGLLASLLTDVPGLAHAFDRGFVAYTNKAKQEMLGVPMALIEAKGAVSQAVAAAMAEGALEKSCAHIALAVTGFADSGDEPGLVYFACARVGRRTICRKAHFGPIGRGATRIECLREGIAMMAEML